MNPETANDLVEFAQLGIILLTGGIVALAICGLGELFDRRMADRDAIERIELEERAELSDDELADRILSLDPGPLDLDRLRADLEARGSLDVLEPEQRHG